jgi:hypothetical protein
VILIIICTACTDKSSVNHKSLNFQVVKTLKIPLKNNNQYIHSQVQLIDSCTILGLDRNFHKLDVFSICENKFLRSIEFEKEGPNRIYPISSFYYHSNDSIFLYSSDASTFQLIDSEAYVLNEWRLFDSKYPKSISDSIIGGNGSSYPFSYTQNSIFHFPFLYDESRGNLIIQIMPVSELAGFGDRKTIFSAPILGRVNLNKGTFEHIRGRWPENYLEEKAPNNPFVHLSLSHDSSNVLLTYFNSDVIFSTKDNKFFEIPSNYFDDRYTLFSINENADYATEEELDAYHNDEGYVNLVHDSYSGLYYRIAKHANEKNENKSMHRMESAWSIIVFNEQFKILGEVLMPEKVYNYLQILPTSNGLLISKENPYSPTNKEEVYEFDLVEIDL